MTSLFDTATMLTRLRNPRAEATLETPEKFERSVAFLVKTFVVSTALFLSMVVATSSQGQSVVPTNAREKIFWDGEETVAFEVYVCPEGEDPPIIGAVVTLQLDKTFRSTQKLGYEAPAATTGVAGSVTLKSDFPAGGTASEDGSWCGIQLRETVLRCEAKGFKLFQMSFKPDLRFEPKEPRIVKVTVTMKRL